MGGSYNITITCVVEHHIYLYYSDDVEEINYSKSV